MLELSVQIFIAVGSLTALPDKVNTCGYLLQMIHCMECVVVNVCYLQTHAFGE